MVTVEWSSVSTDYILLCAPTRGQMWKQKSRVKCTGSKVKLCYHINYGHKHSFMSYSSLHFIWLLYKSKSMIKFFFNLPIFFFFCNTAGVAFDISKSSRDEFVLFGKVTCFGNETSFLDCYSLGTECRESYAVNAGVLCYNHYGN